MREHHVTVLTARELEQARRELAASLAQTRPGSSALVPILSHLARDRGHLTSKLAVAITRTTQPDPARAVSLGMQALTTARDTDSARIMRELRTLDTLLTERGSGHPAGRFPRRTRRIKARWSAGFHS